VDHANGGEESTQTYPPNGTKTKTIQGTMQLGAKKRREEAGGVKNRSMGAEEAGFVTNRGKGGTKKNRADSEERAVKRCCWEVKTGLGGARKTRMDKKKGRENTNRCKKMMYKTAKVKMPDEKRNASIRGEKKGKNNTRPKK